MMDALYSASKCMPQDQGLALHAADKVGKNNVTVILSAAVPTVPCQCCSTGLSVSDLPVTFG